MNYSPSGQPEIPEDMTTFTQSPDVMKEVVGWNCVLDQESSGGAKTILIAEDEAFVRNVTAEVLRSAGYRVLTARNAEGALVAYREYAAAVDLLLTDVILPGETGLTLAGRFRREDSELKVLFVTGYADQLGCCRSGIRRMFGEALQYGSAATENQADALHPASSGRGIPSNQARLR